MSARRRGPAGPQDRPVSTTPLPPLLARWVETLLGAKVPAETRATCQDCTMLRLDPVVADRFDPATKCCTFWPTLPNYAVGAILADRSRASAAGRARVLAHLARRVGTTPLGLAPPRLHSRRYEDTGADGAFGHDRSLRCPYLDGTGGCSIRRHREATCATWFCRFERRAVGYHFWRELRTLLQAAQRAVATHCLLELGLDADALLRLHHDNGQPRQPDAGELPAWLEPDGRLDGRAAVLLWGRWRGREAAFYRACAARARGLEWPDVRALGGVRLAVVERRVRAAFARLGDATVPAVLCATDLAARPMRDGRVALRSEETPFDPLVLEQPVWRALACFDGRGTGAAMRRAAQAHGVTLTPELLRLLIDGGALAVPDGHDIPPRDRPATPLARRDRLCFFRRFRGAAVAVRMRSGKAGRQELRILCGHKEILFDRPEMIELGRRLVAAQNGFYAEEALSWSPPHVTYSWKRVRRLLETLLAQQVLQRLPRPR